VKKDIVIAAVAVVIVVAVAFGLAAIRPNTPGTPSQPFGGDGETTAEDKPAADDKIVMRVNGQPVTEREFHLFVQSAPAESRAFYGSPQGRRALADELVKLKVLEQEGRRMNIASDPEVRTQLSMMRAQIMAGRTLEKLADQKVEDKIRAEYEKEKGKAFSLRHILISYAGGGVPARDGQQAPSAEAALQKANGIVERIRGGADFAQMARTESDDVQSAQQGGNLGPANPEMLPPDIGAVVSKLKPGQLSDPVKTQFGVHIFKVEQPTLEDLRPMLRQKVRQEVAEAEVSRLEKAAKVDLDNSFFPPAPATPKAPPAGTATPKQ
jgi:peptidyl-prolyl cis-trans isomerase C